MSEETKAALYHEVEQIASQHESRADRASIHARKEYLDAIAQILLRAKEMLDENEYDMLLKEIETPRDTANSMIEDFLERRFYKTEVEPLANRFLEAFSQIHRIGSLHRVDEQPHYAKMIVNLRNELYELAEEIDTLNTTHEVRDTLRGLPLLPTYKETLDNHFEHLRRLAEDKEYARECYESWVAENADDDVTEEEDEE
jgi:hypothetical protein